MSLSKFLSEIKKPDTLPGPFAIRLRYELRNEFMTIKKTSVSTIVSTSFLFVCVAVIGLFILKPQVAQSAHNFISGQEKKNDFMVLSNEGTYLGESPSSMKAVSQNQTVDTTGISLLEEDKTYVIRKIKDNNNRSIYYISEIKQSVAPHIIY